MGEKELEMDEELDAYFFYLKGYRLSNLSINSLRKLYIFENNGDQILYFYILVV
jgi:hypothetical protein